MTIRIFFVFCILIGAFSILTVRLFYWQIIRHDELKSIAFAQSSESFELSPIRGQIFSSDNFSLATNNNSYLLYANPKLISEKDHYAEKLSKILEIDEASISAKLHKDLYFVKLKSGIDLATKNKVKDLNLKGLDFEQINSRYYPEGSMSAHLLGFVGHDENGNDKGYFGLEGYYEQQLAGRSGMLHVIHDAHGNTILQDIREEKKIDGRSLHLTLDRTIQYAAEKKLKEGIEKYEADGGSVIVMEPSTGKILAMTSFPSFNPQTYYDFDPSSYKNPVITEVYEPGSTFKTIVMAAAIDKGLVTPDTKCTICDSAVQVGEYKIKTWNDKYNPNSTMTDVIIHSDNTGMVFVSRKLGLSTMYSVLRNFGIGQPTGVDLQGEGSGILKDQKDWYPIDLATSSFGQGLSVTPLQLITAVNAIANGGKIVTPFVVSDITTDDNKTIHINPTIKRQVISESAATVVREMMVAAVEKGESKWTKLDHYKIAGKTGTAQIPVAGHYDPNQTIASFIGFVPADNPKVSMLVIVNRPKKSIYGADTAAPIFFNIAKEIINYYGIQPDS